MSRAGLLWLAVGCAVAAAARAQQEPVPPPPTGSQPQQPAQPVFESASSQSGDHDDYSEAHVFGGFRVVLDGIVLEVRGTHALLLLDRDQSHATATAKDDGQLPRRGIASPPPRRRLSNDELRARVERTLGAVGRPNVELDPKTTELALELVRYVYCEGGVIVVRDGVEVLRCERLWISPLDDRIVVEQAELRYITPGRAGNDTLVVRAPKLVKQGSRWTGRDVTLTMCSAGEPHYAMAVAEVEIIERPGEFEVVARGQTLQVGGTSVLPLPDAHVFTGSQSQFPIRSVGAGYSGKEGARAEVVLGLPWNTAGGAVHEWLTGRPASEFRGDWELGVGWIEKRGEPLNGIVKYGAAGLYEGRTEGFFIDDRGDDLREITTNFDGSDIPEGTRGLVRSQNRVHFGSKTHLDLVAFHGSDPAVWSEYFPAPYRTEEVPETSGYLHHADGNRLLTVGTRFNLSQFSYRDDRALAPRFIEELPVVTYQWLAQPIATTPWQTPIVVDFATQIGQRRSDYDEGAPRVSDRTTRADQLGELSMPFRLAGWNVRPYANAFGSFYDETLDGDSEARIALAAGVALGTRFQRTWSWLDGGEVKSLRHVIAPKVTYDNRYRVDDSPAEFLVFDDVDTLSERQLVRVELRNLLQTMEPTPAGRQPRDFVFVDLAQDLFPDKNRDNGGDALGLFYYDVLLRPRVRWLPFDNFAFALYGDHDWEQGLRTLDTELMFGKLIGLDWTADYRTDALVDGAVGVTAATKLLSRWDLYAGMQRDLQADLWLNYSFGLRRNDHDWSIQLSTVYDPYADETTVRLEFVPRLGGFGQLRRDRFGFDEGPGRFATAY